MPADIKTGIKYSMIKLQSGEVRKIRSDCYATCGQVSKLVPRLELAVRPRSLTVYAFRPSPANSTTNAVSERPDATVGSEGGRVSVDSR